MNPLSSPTATATLSEGNLKASASSIVNSYATIGMSSGKWYWEAYCEDVGGAMLGIGNDPSATGDTGNYKYYVNGNKYDPSGASSYGASYTTGDIIAFTYDADIGTLTAYKNNVSQGTMFSSLSGTYFPFFRSAGGTPDIVYNFGQDSSFAGNKTAQGNADGNGYGDFYYTPPSGFLALCTQNLPDPTVIPSEHFNTVLYTGTGSARDIDLGISSDFTWIKSRSATGSHALFDQLRKGSTYHSLTSNDTSAENTSNPWVDGVGTQLSLTGAGYNTNGVNYISWNWKANGSGVSNTDGTITSTVSANVDAGFSIVSYTGNSGNGATVGHGLTQAPEMIITKRRETAGGAWGVYSKPVGNNFRLRLNDTTAKESTFDYWFDTDPTSSVFYLGNHADANYANEDTIAYCFHSVDGFSKVGSYTGNGSTDGTFVYTGFRPAYVMTKRSDSSEHWVIQDTERSIYNPIDDRLLPNSSGAEAVDWESGSADVDFLSNGFKMRTSYTPHNASGGTYIYIAFAEHPFKYTNAR